MWALDYDYLIIIVNACMSKCNNRKDNYCKIIEWNNSLEPGLSNFIF